MADKTKDRSKHDADESASGKADERDKRSALKSKSRDEDADVFDDADDDLVGEDREDDLDDDLAESKRDDRADAAFVDVRRRRDAGRERLPPFPSAEDRRGGSSMLGAVGIVLIGLVALAAFFMSLLDFFGLGPENERAASAVAGVATSDAELRNVELSSTEAEALRRAVEERLAELSGDVRQRADALERDIVDVRTQLTALNAAPATAEPAAAPAVDLSGLEREIADLRGLVAALEGDDQADRLASEVDDLRADIADVESRFAALGVRDMTGAGGPVLALSDLDADPIAALSAQISRLDRRVSDFNNTVVADLAQKVGRLDAGSPEFDGFVIKTADGAMTCRPTGGGADAEFYCTPAGE